VEITGSLTSAKKLVMDIVMIPNSSDYTPSSTVNLWRKYKCEGIQYYKQFKKNCLDKLKGHSADFDATVLYLPKNGLFAISSSGEMAKFTYYGGFAFNLGYAGYTYHLISIG